MPCFAATPTAHACCGSGIAQAEMPCCTVSPAAPVVFKAVLPDLSLLPPVALDVHQLLTFEIQPAQALAFSTYRPNQRERYLDLRRLLN